MALRRTVAAAALLAAAAGFADEPREPARASLLVCSPGGELYSCVGHAALRMESPEHGLDLVFTTEGESAKARFLRFLAGRLKMGTFSIPTGTFLDLYRGTGRGVVQFPLDLPEETVARLWQALDERVARGADRPWDYLDHGCAQEILLALDEALAPERVEPSAWPASFSRTRREILHDAISASRPWNTFFLWAIVGTEADADVPRRRKVVLPADLLAVLRASVVDGKPVAPAKGEELLPAAGGRDGRPWVTPMTLAWAVLALVLVQSRIGSPRLEKGLLALHAAAGAFFFWAVFFSSIPASGWNWLVVPFNPLPAALWKRRRKAWPWFSGSSALWILASAISPHTLVEPAWLVLSVAYAIFFATSSVAARPASTQKQRSDT